jgi:glycosyltransferase involved in cell wall biosynthesis
MRIKLFGDKSPLSCYKQVYNEFVRLGHEMVEEGDCDLIYHTCGFFDDAILYKEIDAPYAKLLCCLLDANPTNPHWPEQRVREQLLKADAALTISNTSRNQILKRTGVDCRVIYYPSKNIYPLYLDKTIKFGWVGRMSGQKRVDLVWPVLQQLGIAPYNFAVAGPEYFNSGICQQFGLLTEENLNRFYNSCEYIFNFSSWEGIGLSCIESILAGTFLVCTKDNECIKEFDLEAFAAEPSADSIANKIDEIECHREFYLGEIKRLQPIFKEMFSVEGYCKRVIEVYNSL